jgi:hypothetical protein
MSIVKRAVQSSVRSPLHLQCNMCYTMHTVCGCPQKTQKRVPDAPVRVWPLMCRSSGVVVVVSSCPSANHPALASRTLFFFFFSFHTHTISNLRRVRDRRSRGGASVLHPRARARSSVQPSCPFGNEPAGNGQRQFYREACEESQAIKEEAKEATCHPSVSKGCRDGRS